MALNPAQARQIEKQLQEHTHSDYTVDLRLSKGVVLKDFSVHAGVMRPERMTSVLLARFLLENKKIYHGKVAMDIGCGSGIQGVTMAAGGAKTVMLSDISAEAVANSEENVKKYHLETTAQVLRSDLFGAICVKADAIIFNHPFFPDSAQGRAPVARTMLDAGELIHRFLKDAKGFLTGGGRIIMPFFHLAGETNDPSVQGPKHGYKVRELSYIIELEGLQRGDISINELRPVK